MLASDEIPVEQSVHLGFRMERQMKEKKAVKKLNKAKALLSSVLDQYASGNSAGDTRYLLRAAVSNIDQAQTSIKSTPASPAARPAKAEVAAAPAKRAARISEEGRKRLSLAAKRRWAAAKRKGARTLSAA